MSKELNLIDAPAADLADVIVHPEVIKLDDLSLLLVGGGQAAVVF